MRLPYISISKAICNCISPDIIILNTDLVGLSLFIFD